jgi:hypothetical protein
MNLRDKRVWDLSLDEIDYVYRHRHMNHYVYAALKTYHTSSPPLQRPVSLRADTIPPYLRGPCERLLQLSPWIGTRDPSLVRASITYHTYLLYSALDQVRVEDVSLVEQLLAACAYLSIVSEKNDNVPLWWYRVVRDKSPYIDAIVEKLLEPVVDIEAVIRMSMSAKDKERSRAQEDMANRNYHFVPKAVTSLIVLMENGADPQRIARAFLQTERAMRTYEQDAGYAAGTPIERHRLQIRYHNTLYLYGGMFFEKQHIDERALDWYLKDINDPGLLEGLLSRSDGFFMLDLKTTERLVSAYALTTDRETRSHLKNLIHGYLVRCVHEAAAYSRFIVDFLKSHPSTDLRDIFFFSGDKRILYGGEASREVYFMSLLYNKYVLGMDFQDIDYARFFQY